MRNECLSSSCDGGGGPYILLLSITFGTENKPVISAKLFFRFFKRLEKVYNLFHLLVAVYPRFWFP